MASSDILVGPEVMPPLIPSLHWVYPGGYLTSLPIYLTEEGSLATVLLNSSDRRHPVTVEQFLATRSIAILAPLAARNQQQRPRARQA
jgi:hypothetical protein